MPDISMCDNIKCNRRMQCYRYRAIPTEHWQSFFSPDEKDCEHFWKIEEGRRIRPEKECDDMIKGWQEKKEE